MSEYSEHVEGDEPHQILRDFVDKHPDIREVSMISHKREVGRGKIHQLV
jgi:hypothetical protein